jgi:hypothetical protein
VAWILRSARNSLQQTGLRCIFVLKKTMSPGAGQYKALVSLLCANLLSKYTPFVVLTDLVDWWTLYWVDGSSIYHYDFDSRAAAIRYIEDLLGMVVTRTFSDGRTDGRSDDGRGGIRDLDAL